MKNKLKKIFFENLDSENWIYAEMLVIFIFLFGLYLYALLKGI